MTKLWPIWENVFLLTPAHKKLRPTKISPGWYLLTPADFDAEYGADIEEIDTDDTDGEKELDREKEKL